MEEKKANEEEKKEEEKKPEESKDDKESKSMKIFGCNKEKPLEMFKKGSLI